MGDMACGEPTVLYLGHSKSQTLCKSTVGTCTLLAGSHAGRTCQQDRRLQILALPGKSFVFIGRLSSDATLREIWYRLSSGAIVGCLRGRVTGRSDKSFHSLSMEILALADDHWPQARWHGETLRRFCGWSQRIFDHLQLDLHATAAQYLSIAVIVYSRIRVRAQP
jgi:hypothetical protein